MLSVYPPASAGGTDKRHSMLSLYPHPLKRGGTDRETFHLESLPTRYRNGTDTALQFESPTISCARPRLLAFLAPFSLAA